MASLKDFNKGWKKLQTLSEIVNTLDKTKGDPSAFASYHSDFLGFVKDAYKLHTPQLAQLNVGDSRQKVSSSQNFTYEVQKNAIIGARTDIKDISADLGDDLEGIAYTLAPLKEIDLDKGNKLTDVAKDYTKKALEKRTELSTINRANDPERYEATEDLAKEYEGFASTINKYKPLVKEIAKYKELVSHLSSNRGKPNTSKMKEIHDELIDRLGKKPNLNKYDKMVLKVTKTLSSNEHYLANYYVEGLVKPAEDKVKETITSNNYKIKDYLDETVGSMNMNTAGMFFNGLYAREAA